MLMRSRFLAVLAVLLLLAGATFAYFRLSQPRTLPQSADQEENETIESSENSKLQATYTYIATESGQLALDLLRSQAEVTTITENDETIITAINSLERTEEYSWAFYLNNELITSDLAQRTLEETDVIRFTYEPVQSVSLQIDSEGNITPVDQVEETAEASTGATLELE